MWWNGLCAVVVLQHGGGAREDHQGRTRRTVLITCSTEAIGAPLLHKTKDFEAFARRMVAAIERSRIKLYAYGLMSNHWQMVVSPEINGKMGRFVQWLKSP